mmetsp:Transcript_35753/g.105692  ORF Transcript_35753/g.105692 Transcript_35753/m.105692 type:complete len:239 (+) Transcript_35753:1575-2291(+)
MLRTPKRPATRRHQRTQRRHSCELMPERSSRWHPSATQLLWRAAVAADKSARVTAMASSTAAAALNLSEQMIRAVRKSAGATTVLLTVAPSAALNVHVTVIAADMLPAVASARPMLQSNAKPRATNPCLHATSRATVLRASHQETAHLAVSFQGKMARTFQASAAVLNLSCLRQKKATFACPCLAATVAVMQVQRGLQGTDTCTTAELLLLMPHRVSIDSLPVLTLMRGARRRAQMQA